MAGSNLNDLSLDKVLDTLDGGLDQSLERLYALLKIPSISTDPAHRNDCEQAAAWLARELADLGFKADVRPTNGLPMVIGHYDAGSGKPHVLFYGHYDVQPPDPLEMWKSPPFEPRMVEEGGIKRIVGRGTADDKGQLMTFIEACRAYIKAEGKLPLSVTVMLEGEEETGSPSLKPFLDKHKKELKADVALVCDTDMWDMTTPAITTMLRGLVLEEVTVTGPNRDLHSGLFGGPALNPIHALGRVLGLPFGLVDRICKLVPANPANPVTLAQAIELLGVVETLWRRLQELRPEQPASAFLTRFRAIVAGYLDPAAVGTAEVLAEVERLGTVDAVGGAFTLASFQRALRVNLEAAAIREGRFGEGVLVADHRAAAGLRFTRVVVCGAAEGLLPAGPGIDALVPDAAWEALRAHHPFVEDAARRVQRAGEAARRALGAARLALRVHEALRAGTQTRVAAPPGDGPPDR